jgi:hypothetical protein
MLIFTLVMAFSATASASWYGSSASFSAKLTGASRYYDGNNVGLNWGNAYNDSPSHVNNGDGFTISLQRKNGIGWITIGSVWCERQGGGGANWTNVGSGTYRFIFSKSNDGTWQYIPYIEMFSW